MISQLLHHITRKVTSVMLLLLVTVLMTGQSHAQWQVIDTAAIASNEKGQASQLMQLVNQLTQLQQTYKQLQDTYNTIRSTISNLGLNLIPINNQLPEISDSDAQAQAREQCPGADPIGMVMNFIGLDMSGDVRTQQIRVCQQIVLRQIHKYNTVAKMLNRMNDYSSNLQSIVDTFSKISALASGDRETSQNQTSQTLTSMNLDMSNTQQQLQADDAAISALQERQSMLAKRAMQGSMLGNAMQVVTFGAALNIGN